MANRPTYTPRFIEDATTITERMVSNIPDEWHKEPGDFIYDAMKTNPAEIIQLEENQDHILRNAFPQYCDDDTLDDLLEVRGLTRTPATHTIRKLSITADAGVKIPQGYTFTSVILDGNGNPIQYAARAETTFTVGSTTKDVYIVCHLSGTVGNIAVGSEFVLQPPIPGIRSITDVSYVAGADKESADEYWTRYKDAVDNPDTGGNVNDYKRWVLNDFTVATQTVIQKCLVEPRWDGPGTVRVVAIDGEYGQLENETITALQTFLDPTASTGLGRGKAPAGASVTVMTGDVLNITVSATIDYTPAADRAQVLAEFTELMTDYIHTRVFEVNPDTNTLYPIAYNKVITLLGGISGVDNFRDVLLNSDTEDVQPAFYNIPTLQAGGVVFNE